MLVILAGGDKDQCVSSGTRIFHLGQLVLICHVCEPEERAKLLWK